MAEKRLVSFAELSAAADTLNNSTDQLTKTVDQLEEALLRLNIGLSSWVEVQMFTDEDGGQYYRIELGWSKSEGTWGFNIHRVEGNNHSDAPEEVREAWKFNYAPRDYRLWAVSKLPELLDDLAKAASKTAENVNKKLVETRALAIAMGIPITVEPGKASK